MSSKPSERNAQIACFKKLFNVSNEVAKSDAVADWMDNASAEVIDFDGYLLDETAENRDIRMKLYHGYDDVNPLAKHLRRHFKDSESPKWSLVFRASNEISNVDDVIKVALKEVLADTEKVTTMPEPIIEPLIDTEMSEPLSKEKSVDSIVTKDTYVETVEEAVPQESVTETVSDTTINAIGHRDTSDDSLLNKTDNINITKKPMEESKMQETNIFEQAVNVLDKDVEMDVTKTQQAPTDVVSNVDANKQQLDAGRIAVVNMLADQRVSRNNYTATNFVDSIISPQQPAALRTQSTEGTVSAASLDKYKKDGVSDAEAAAKRDAAIAEKLTKFLVAITGDSACTTIELFDAKAPEAKFANVVVDEGGVNVKKAAAILELWKEVVISPEKKFQAFIPSADKLSYPIKGFFVAGKPMSQDDFIITVLDKGNGILYGQGSIDAKGEPIDAETCVLFKVGVAKRTQTAKAGEVGTNAIETKVPVVRPRNKKAFLNTPGHVVYLFPVTGETATSSFKASITVDGVAMGATVSCYKLDVNGNKEKRSAESDKFKTSVASFAISVPVNKVERKVVEECRLAGQEASQASVYYGYNLVVDSTDKNYANIADINNSPATDVFAEVWVNESLRRRLMGKSETAKQIASGVASAEEAESAAAADIL